MYRYETVVGTLGTYAWRRSLSCARRRFGSARGQISGAPGGSGGGESHGRLLGRYRSRRRFPQGCNDNVGVVHVATALAPRRSMSRTSDNAAAPGGHRRGRRSARRAYRVGARSGPRRALAEFKNNTSLPFIQK